MIQFRQKEYGALGLVAMVAPGMVQSHNQNKKNAEQQEQFQRQNAKLQEKQTEAMNKIAKAAEKDPSKIQAVNGLMEQQRSYAIPLKLSSGVVRALAKGKGNLRRGMQKGGQVVYEFAKGIGSDKITKTIGSGIAMGGTMAIGSYALDKAIQADRKRLTGGAPLPQAPQKSQEEKAKERNRKIAKAAIGATTLAGGILAARKGYLGKGFQNLSKGLNSKGTKINGKALLQDTGKHLKSGFGLKQIAGGAAFGAAFTLPGYISQRKQLKDQAQQQKQYSEEERLQQNPRPKNRVGSVLKKAAIGTAATVGTVATLRRVGPAGLRKSINEMYMTYGKKLAGKSGNGKLGNWMMNSGANQWGKAQASVVKEAISNKISSGNSANSILTDYKKLKEIETKRFKDKPEEFKKYLDKLKLQKKQGQNAGRAVFDAEKYADKVGKLKLQNITSNNGTISNFHRRKLGEGFLGGVSKIMGIGRKTTKGFLGRMAQNPNNSESTRKTAAWLQKHGRTALAGSVAVGGLAWKPFGWGDAAVRKPISAIDKNAFAYEKSQEQQVPE